MNSRNDSNARPGEGHGWVEPGRERHCLEVGRATPISAPEHGLEDRMQRISDQLDQLAIQQEESARRMQEQLDVVLAAVQQLVVSGAAKTASIAQDPDASVAEHEPVQTSPLFGMWRDRSEVEDVAGYVRRIRAPRCGRGNESEN